MAEGGKAQEGQEKENNKEPCDERWGAAASLPPARWRGAAQPAPGGEAGDAALLLPRPALPAHLPGLPPSIPHNCLLFGCFLFFEGGRRRRLLFVPLNFSLFLCIRLLSSFGIYKSKRAGGCGGGKGGRRAALFIGTQGFACIMRAAFVLPPTSSPAGLECRQPHCPQRCLPLLQGAPRRGHVVRGSRGEKKPPGAPLPPRLRFSQPLTKRWGKGGAGKGGERREKKKKRQKKGHFPPVIGTRSAARQWGRARLAAAPALRRTRRRRRSHDGGYPHTTWSATGSALPAASRPSRRPGHGASAGFHIIKPPDFGGEAISWAGWLH